MSYARLWLALVILPLAAAFARGADPSSTESDFFEKKIRPLLSQHCYGCHSATAKKIRGGLRLDSRAALLAGGDSGTVLVPGQPQKSRLIEAVAYTNVELQMPPRGKLPGAALADLTRWVKAGAPWPGQAASDNVNAGPRAFDLAERKRSHWAWQQIRPQTPPSVRDAAWPRDALDQFILAKLEEKALTPAAPADRRTLLRRLSFDLIGLPPSPDELDAFLRDQSPDAMEKVVDRLLSSPHFGERWARHWLDLVRYAETRGHEFDYPIPNAYHYRDYVIRALNNDIRYDRFVLEHFAGDLLPQPRLHPQQRFNESILATGFWSLGEEVHSPVDIRQDQADRFDNKVDVLSKAFLGLTVACARCHDHKFDAISTKDYYALFGYLQSSHYRLARFDSMEHNRRVAEELVAFRRKNRPAVQHALAESLRPGAERLADYLLAARGELTHPDDATRLAKIAQARKLDTALLSKWTAHLRTAARNERDPFHVWAKLAADPPAEDVKHFRAALASLAARGKSEEPTSGLNREIVLDYAHCPSEKWMTDGFAFGAGPVRPGELRVGGDEAKPTLRFVDRAAAEKDPTWDVLKLAPGTQNEPGALGAVVRAGRTLYTPTFRVTTGKVYYLVKGSGLVYASIGSHVMIAGPLHGQLLQTINTGERYQWIAHDVSAYPGQRIHLEFSPNGSAPLAVSCIVQGDKPPALVEHPNEALLAALADADSLESLAKAYQRVLLDLLRDMSEDRLIGSPARARLANALLDRAALLGVTSPQSVARPYLAEERKIAARIQRESSLCAALIEGSPEDEYVFIRGSHKARGETVPRRFLEALAGPAAPPSIHGSGRLELARQMIDPTRDPFLPRVLVNRVWHHLFGRGIVASTDNFGVLGERPTHPELLDYLAARFVQNGWSQKKLIRSLVLSNTYRMASASSEAFERADPDDLFLHRMRRRRLEGEAIRDAMLALSGRLDGRLYGPSVLIHLTEFQEGRGRPASGPLDGGGRRSLYLAVRRNFLSSFLLAFDTPTPFSTVGRRTVSNVPAQSLILLNDPFVHEQARLWARRTLAEPGSARERIVRLYESAFTRSPTETELADCLAFVQRVNETSSPSPLVSEGRGGGAVFPKPVPPTPTLPHKGGWSQTADELAVWTDLAHVLFNVKEFIFVN